MTSEPRSVATPADDDDVTRATILTTGERPLRLIVVEDDALVAMVLAETIEAAGGQIVGTAATAQDATMLATERDIDAAVIDLHLKGQSDGISAAQAICKRSRAAVIFITGSANAETIARVRAFNGSAPLFKPLRYSELPNAILHAFASGRSARNSI